MTRVDGGRVEVGRRQALAALGAGAVWAAGRPAQAQALPLRCSGSYGEGVFHTQNLQAFARQAGELSKGAVQIEVTPNARLKPMKDVLPALSKGEMAFGEVLMSSYGAQHPLLAIDSLPFIVRSFEDAARMWEASRPAIEAEMAGQGVRVLYAVPWPGQGLYSRTPVNLLQDLKGLKFRVYNDATKRLAELSGAVPVNIAANDLPKAIESGQVDAMLTSSTTGVDSQAWKAMGYFLDLRAWIPKNMVCVSESIWKTLSPDARNAVLEAAKQAETRGWQMARAADDAAKKQLAEQKIKVGLASADFRRTLDLLGERFGREWSQKAGLASTSALLGYYTSRQ